MTVLTKLFAIQDSFYKYHNEEELALAHANMLDFDHPDAIDMSLFASVRASSSKLILPLKTDSFIRQCLGDLKACKQSNIPVYSFAKHQRLAETKYLYGATIIIGKCIDFFYIFFFDQHTLFHTAEGIMALVDPALRALYDLKVGDKQPPLFIAQINVCCFQDFRSM